jgi:hypothetical protein
VHTRYSFARLFFSLDRLDQGLETECVNGVSLRQHLGVTDDGMGGVHGRVSNLGLREAAQILGFGFGAPVCCKGRQSLVVVTLVK